jgi:hypothetical protein
MIKIKTLLSSVLTLTLFSATAMAVDFNSKTELKKSTPTAYVKTVLAAKNGQIECIPLKGDSTATAWNTGEICFVSDTEPPSTSFSAAIGPEVMAFTILQDIFEARSTLGAECISAGGSTAMTEPTAGFCMASDLNTAQADVANFSVDNGLPVAGMQFLQATFGDGSTQSASAPITSECISAGGSTPFSAMAEGFCLVSDLSRSLTDFARFSVVNALPVVGLQFLQLKLDPSLLGESLPSGTGTECLLVGGSSAATGLTGGFCLASDLNVSTEAFTSFSVAHNAPVTDLQFLQVTFGDSSQSGELSASRGAGAPVGAECISVEGSIAASGNPGGFCLASDLVRSALGSVNITIANDLPVTGMQFLQATFGSGGELSSPRAPIGTECESVEGSIAAAGNVKGFCLVSDLIGQTVGSANFSVANGLPVTAWEFLQVPSEDIIPRSGSNLSAPVGVTVSNFMALPFDLPFTADEVSSRPSFFHLSDQTDEMEVFSTPYWRLYPNLGLWVGR